MPSRPRSPDSRYASPIPNLGTHFGYITMPKIARPTKPLADVNVLPQNDGTHEIVVCFQADPQYLVDEGEARAALALDASRSLRKMYGFGGPFGGDPNYVQAVARKLGALLCSVTRTGESSAIYWAVHNDGTRIEPIGTYSEAAWASVDVDGPKTEKWGAGTKLLPAIKHVVESVADGSDWTMGVILTDGIIEDEEDCTKFCMQIGKEMADESRNPIKLVLIGIGEEVDEGQLERFDDMFEGTGIDYDLWSSGMVASMKDESDILAVLYGELIHEDMIVADSGHVSCGGTTIESFSDGLPGKFRFILPKGEKSFTVHVGGRDLDITQDVSEVVG